MMSRIARKSPIAQSSSNQEYLITQAYKENNVFHGIILDICGAHKPATKFMPDKKFDKGIFFIVFIKENYKVYDLYYGKPYEYLRTLYGNDDNIIGRNLLIYSRDDSTNLIRYSNFDMVENKRNRFEDEDLIKPVSRGFLTGGPVDPKESIKGLFENPSAGMGEMWKKPE